MPRERFTIRALGVAALLVAALGLGAFLGAPEVAVAQEDTSTTVVVDDTADTAIDESAEIEDETRGEHDCGDRSSDSSGEESTQSDA